MSDDSGSDSDCFVVQFARGAPGADAAASATGGENGFATSPAPPVGPVRGAAAAAPQRRQRAVASVLDSGGRATSAALVPAPEAAAQRRVRRRHPPSSGERGGIVNVAAAPAPAPVAVPRRCATPAPVAAPLRRHRRPLKAPPTWNQVRGFKSTKEKVLTYKHDDSA